jgi:SNF2 family DNA or RNA helicase
MKWLPKKEPPVRILLPPTKEQLKYLKELKDYFETETIITQGVLDRLIRYRQICLHPALIGLRGKSPKLEWIRDYLADYPERPTIIFTKFTSFIHILEKELTNINYRTIVGATPDKQRFQAIEDFQTKKCNLLILNIDVGKESLTLDRAEAIIFTDKYPPAGDIDQAQDRFITTTEANANIPKVIYELAIRDTYDEECYALVERRAAAVDAINNFKKYMKGG